MGQITAFKASNGKMFDNKTDALQEERLITLTKAFKEIIANNCHDELMEASLLNFLLNSRVELSNLFDHIRFTD